MVSLQVFYEGRVQGVGFRFTVRHIAKGFDPARRGYQAVYHVNEVNHCPGCGRSHWLVGRTLAECAFCATALPLKEARRAER